MLYSHSALEKEQLKQLLNAQNYHDIHVQEECMLISDHICI